VGALGLRTTTRANGNLPHICIAGGYCHTHQALNKTQNFAFSFCHMWMTSCSGEKRYQALPTSPYCKHWKPAWGPGNEARPFLSLIPRPPHPAFVACSTKSVDHDQFYANSTTEYRYCKSTKSFGEHSR